MSRYIVTFRRRFDFNGEPGQDPSLLLDFAEGVIEGAEYVQTLEPPSVHSTEDIGGSPTSQSAEDDGFLSSARKPGFSMWPRAATTSSNTLYPIAS